jgi:hypothetical protein
MRWSCILIVVSGVPSALYILLHFEGDHPGFALLQPGPALPLFVRI